jgi:hypothetical protein
VSISSPTVTIWDRPAITSLAIATMSPAPARSTRRIVTAISALMLLGALAIVMFAALRSPLKDDIAWLFYVARRWMSGRELYVDVIEVNPPLIVWISAIPLSVAGWLDISPKYTAIPGFAAMVLACAWWSACLLKPKGGIFADRFPVFAAIGCVLLLVPGSELGQREHLLVAAFLPYLIVFARTVDGIRPPAFVSLAVGVLAGLGCALKPQYGLVFAALEGVALYHRMRPWRMAPLAAGATLAAYVGLVAIVCPAYLRHAVPLAMALYGATDVSFPNLLWESAPLLGAEALALFLWWRRDGTVPRRTLMLTGLVFALTSSLICFIDGKDWFYHRLPATVITLLVLVLWTISAFIHRQPGQTPWRSLAVAGFAVIVFCAGAIQRIDPEMRQAVEPQRTTVARLEDLIRENHARTYVAFSEWLALGFPVVNNTGVAWASRFDSMWALKGEVWRAGFDRQAAREWPVAHWVAHDFIAGCPDIAVVDTRMTMNYISVLSAAEPTFARAWSRYRPIAKFDGLAVYKRGKGGCIDPWVAAEGPGRGTTIR